MERCITLCTKSIWDYMCQTVSCWSC